MHAVQIAVLLPEVVRQSVSLSVCLSVRDIEVPWSYKLGYVRSSEPQRRQSSPRGTPQNSGELAENLQYCETIQVGSRLLLISNRKLHTRFRLVPESVTLDDLERPLRSLLCFKIHASLGARREKLNEDRPILSAAKIEWV